MSDIVCCETALDHQKGMEKVGYERLFHWVIPPLLWNSGLFGFKVARAIFPREKVNFFQFVGLNTISANSLLHRFIPFSS